MDSYSRTAEGRSVDMLDGCMTLAELDEQR